MVRTERMGSHFWRLGSVPPIEELWKRAFLNGVDAVVSEPRGVAGDYNVVGLNDRALLLRKTLLLCKNSFLLILHMLLLPSSSS